MRIKKWMTEQFSKKSIYVRYKGAIYKVNIIDGLFIIHQQLWLFFRRFLRLSKRTVYRSTDTFIVIITAILFSAIIIPIGLFMNEYEKWYDAIWDMRTFLLTSVFVVLVNTNINAERDRRQSLHKQFDIYSSFNASSEFYIKDLLLIIGKECDTDIFLTQSHIDDFDTNLMMFGQTKRETHPKFNKKEIIELISLHKKYIINLNNIANIVDFSNELELRKEDLRQSIDTARNIVEKETLILEHSPEDYSYEKLIDFISNYVIYQQHIINELRGPWRWDHARNMEIRYRLVTNGKFIKGGFDSNEYWFD